MYLLLIYFLIALIIFNILLWVYDAKRSKESIVRSKKAFKIGLIITILSYVILLTYGLICYWMDKT
jgi:hypothetical protein